MLAARTAAAWLLLAVAVFGGTVAPAVHRVAHGMERADLAAAHAADGHHVRGERGQHLHETCATRAQDDVACTLCQGVSAALVGGDAAQPDTAPASRPDVETEARGHGRALSAPTGRGPPERAA